MKKINVLTAVVTVLLAGSMTASFATDPITNFVQETGKALTGSANMVGGATDSVVKGTVKATDDTMKAKHYGVKHKVKKTYYKGKSCTKAKS